jgi:hypothetical protein
MERHRPKKAIAMHRKAPTHLPLAVEQRKRRGDKLSRTCFCQTTGLGLTCKWEWKWNWKWKWNAHRNLHVLKVGMGNGLMTCKTKESRIGSGEIRTQRIISRYQSFFQLHSPSSPLALNVVIDQSTECTSIPIFKTITSKLRPSRNL